jgi:CheY-like chemotaxis protein
MTQEPVSPLRRTMIEDMSIRQFGAKTQTNYVRVVRDLVAFADYDLPNGVTGLQAVLAIRERLHQPIPAIILTGTSPRKLSALSRRKIALS